MKIYRSLRCYKHPQWSEFNRGIDFLRDMHEFGLLRTERSELRIDRYLRAYEDALKTASPVELIDLRDFLILFGIGSALSCLTWLIEVVVHRLPTNWKLTFWKRTAQDKMKKKLPRHRTYISRLLPRSRAWVIPSGVMTSLSCGFTNWHLFFQN